MNTPEKQNKCFLSISRIAKIVTIVATLCSFKITELFSIMKTKKSQSDSIKFLLFLVNSENVWYKTRFASNRGKGHNNLHVKES